MAKKKKKGKFKLIVILAIVVAAVIAIVVMKSNAKPEGIPVTTGKSKTGDITSVVTATGKIHPEIEVKISSEVSGEIIELPVKDGMKVEKGDLLVKVNPDTLDAQVKQQEAALSASKANSSQAKAQMLKAELDLKRTQSLFEKGFATQDELDQAQTGLEVSKASYESSVFRIQQQDMQLREAKDTLAKASTYAPISGTITRLNSELGDRVVGTGQFAGTEIMRLADLNNMEVRVDVSEADIINVKVGDEADIEIDALPDEKFEGVVTEIANSARTSNAQSQEQLTTFEVKVKLTSTDGKYRPGMTATADIKTKTVTDVVYVPLQSVTVRQKSEVKKQLSKKSDKKDKDSEEKAEKQEEPKEEQEDEKEESDKEDKDEGEKSARDSLQRVVFVVKDGKAILTPIETGIADNKSIEVTEGLESGEKIVTGSYGVLTRRLRHESDVSEKNNNEGKPGNK
ncbi:MAG: efflux RND transporter periplasmic adaptor subunit [Opitutales bacterium]|nr:efflux RND transporter periplasmic adaptor subunit [Opitutales bacterium]